MNIDGMIDYNNMHFETRGELLSGDISGFVRIEDFFPSYLIVLFKKKNNEHYCRIPSGETYYFHNPKPFDILKKSSSFIENYDGHILLPFQIGFAYSSYEIIVDFKKKIFESLKNSLSRKDLSSDKKSIIFSYFDNEKKF